MRSFLLFFVFLFISASGMAQWQQISVPTVSDLYSVTFTDSLHGFISGRGLTLKSSDGGNSWEVAFTTDPWDQLTNISFPTSNVGYVVGDYSITKTVDGGNTWNSTATPFYETVRGVYFHNPDTGFICGAIGIWSTKDGGDTWTNIVSSNVWLRRFSFPVHDTGFCIGDWQTVYKTTDGGETWIMLQGGLAPNLSAVSFPVCDTGFVSGPEGFIARTKDGGNSWEQLNSGTSLNFENALFALTPENVYAGGQDGLLLKTMNGGDTWIAEESGTQSYLRGMYFFPSGRGYICGHDGLVITNAPCLNTVASFTCNTAMLTASFQNQSACAMEYWWSFGDGYFSDLKNPWHIYDDPGEYTVCLIATNTTSMVSDTTCQILEMEYTGIGNDKYSSVTTIYPNPCVGKFTIKTTDQNSIDKIEIINSLGSTVLAKADYLSWQSPVEINIDLPAGLYFVLGYSENTIKFREKLVVVH